NNNVTGQDMDDDDEEEDQNSYDENEDKYNDLDIEQNKLLQSNMKSFLGQSGANDTVQVTETSGQTDGQSGKAVAREESNENQNSDRTQTAENGAQNDRPNASLTPSTEEQKSSLQNTSDQSSSSTNDLNTDKKNVEELQKTAELSNLKNIDKLYDELLDYLDKKKEVNTNNYLTKYNEFKNKFDQFILNDHEYELL
ncbi:MSP7-like protein, partial [Plasmodium gaboni]